MEIPVRIAQTRTTAAQEESLKGLNRQILSTRLAADTPLWVIVSSMNYEELPGSYYLEPDPPVGKISRRFLQLILEEIQRIYPKIAVTSRR